MVFNSDIDSSLIKMREKQMITFGSPADLSAKKTSSEHCGRYLSKSGANTLILGIYAAKEDILKYDVNDELVIYYLDSNIKYHFKARIVHMRPEISEDEFEINENDIDKDILNELKNKPAADKYIIEAAALTRPEINNKREFFRMTLQMEIYFKKVIFEELDEITEADLKFEIAQAMRYKKEADEGILDEEAGYTKIITADISAGGFMFKSPVHFELEMFMECMMMVDREALPVVAQVLRSRHDEILDGYFVHAQFYKISEPVRDRLVKYLFNQQRQQQSRFLRR